MKSSYEPAHVKKVLITLANSEGSGSQSQQSLHYLLKHYWELEEASEKRTRDLTPLDSCAWAFEGTQMAQSWGAFSHDLAQFFYERDLITNWFQLSHHYAFFRPSILVKTCFTHWYLKFHEQGISELFCMFYPQTLKIEPSHDKTNKMTVRTAKTQISLGSRPVWSESSLCA